MSQARVPGAFRRDRVASRPHWVHSASSGKYSMLYLESYATRGS
jgi:hypothetical protein